MQKVFTSVTFWCVKQFLVASLGVKEDTQGVLINEQG